MKRITTKEEALARIRHSIQIKKDWIEESNKRLRNIMISAKSVEA